MEKTYKNAINPKTIMGEARHTLYKEGSQGGKSKGAGKGSYSKPKKFK